MAQGKAQRKLLAGKTIGPWKVLEDDYRAGRHQVLVQCLGCGDKYRRKGSYIRNATGLHGCQKCARKARGTR